MMTLGEARQFFSEDELSDEELMQLVSEIDRIQLQVLDSFFLHV